MSHSNNGNSGCFSGMLRRLLCSGNLPTHPSDSMTESNGGEFEKQTTEVSFPAPELRPGVVAQLMGLNSLPDSNWVPKKRSPDSVSRSKSVNFVDYLLEFDDRNQARHRRVRTASFREVSPAPATFLNQENELLVDYMKDFGKEKEIGSNMKKSELGFGEIKQGKEKSNNLVKKKENQKKKMKISKLKDEPRREIGKKYLKNRKCNGKKDLVSVLPSYKKQSFNKNAKSSQKKKMIQTEVSSGKKPEKKSRTGTETGTKNKKKKNVVIQPDCDTENWSPSSVLEFSKKTKNCDDQMEENVMKKKDYDGYFEMVGRICRLAEEDLREGNWMDKNMYEFDELCMEIERHVVSALLVQIFDDLV